MYQLQYWNGSAAEWRDAGFTSNDYDEVVTRMRGARLDCRDLVRFRIEQVPTPVTAK